MTDGIATRTSRAAIIAAVLALAVSVSWATAEEKKRRVIREKVVIDCKGDDSDCETADEQVHRIVLGDGEGSTNQWVEADGDGKKVRRIVIGDGDGTANEWVEDDGDGKRVRRMVIGDGDETANHWVEADGDHKRVHRIVIGDGDGENQWFFKDGDGALERLVDIAGSQVRILGDGLVGGGFLGVGLTELTPELRRHFGASEAAGVLVSRVLEGSPAEGAGLAVGDVISAVDGEAVASGSALAHAIRAKADGESVSLEIWRDKRLETVTAVIEERSGPAAGQRQIFVCDDEDSECGTADKWAFLSADCGEGEPCEVQVECENDECDCTVNGEPADCEPQPGD